MKRLFSFLALAAALSAFAMVATPAPLNAQASDTAMNSIIADITAQQTQIGENQVQIDAKLGVAAEAVRQARLFASRGGGTTK